MPKFRMAYYAYPIDLHDGDGMLDWFDFIRIAQDNLRNYYSIQYDPGDAFRVERGAELGAEIYNINREALYQADLVLAFLPAKIPTVGVVLELEQAAFLGKTVVIFTDAQSWSLQGRFGDQDNVFMSNTDAVDFGGWPALSAWLNAREATGDASRADRHPVPLPVLPIRGGSHRGSPRLPSRTYADDAGLDLYASHEVTIDPGAFYDVPCSIAVELPQETWGLLIGRSSTLRKKKLLVHPGVIDAGYRGELFAGVWNMNTHRVVVAEGERLAQLIVLPNLTMELLPQFVEGLGPHPRGEKGFGSTGV